MKPNGDPINENSSVASGTPATPKSATKKKPAAKSAGSSSSTPKKRKTAEPAADSAELNAESAEELDF